MENITKEEQNTILSKQEQDLLHWFRSMNKIGQNHVLVTAELAKDHFPPKVIPLPTWKRL